MKTFRELISWELEQDSKRGRASLSLSEDDGGGNLTASVLRKLRYLNSRNESPKTAPDGFSPA
ncbi:MAG TPA: hypothetical protein VF773_21555 [Verrucomicrobiae bacterium]